MGLVLIIALILAGTGLGSFLAWFVLKGMLSLGPKE